MTSSLKKSHNTISNKTSTLLIHTVHNGVQSKMAKERRNDVDFGPFAQSNQALHVHQSEQCIYIYFKNVIISGML